MLHEHDKVSRKKRQERELFINFEKLYCVYCVFRGRKFVA